MDFGDLLGFFTGGLVGGAVTAVLLPSCSSSYIPNDEKVQKGFVAPAAIEILVQDADLDGDKETIAKVSGKPYLIMYDKDNHPVFNSYKLSPINQNTQPKNLDTLPKNYEQGRRIR